MKQLLLVTALLVATPAVQAHTSQNVLFTCEGKLMNFQGTDGKNYYNIREQAEKEYPMDCDIDDKVLRRVLAVCHVGDICIVSAKGESGNGNRYLIQKVFEVHRHAAATEPVQPGVGIGWVKSSDLDCDLNNTCSLKNNYAVKGCVTYGVPVYSRPDGMPVGELVSEVVAGYGGVVQGEKLHGYTYVSYPADSKDVPSLLPFDIKGLHSCG